MSGRFYAQFWILTGLLALILIAGTITLLVLPLPASAQMTFATNTPPPTPTTDPLANTPDVPRQQYALRLWTERDLLDVLAAQLSRLRMGEDDQRQAVRLTLHELEQRFPGAPRQPEQRERIIRLMMAAPRGSVDKRSIVRPYVVSLLNAHRTEINPADAELIAEGFLLEITPLNLNSDAIPDALVTVRYPANAIAAEALYVDYLPVLGIEDGGYRLIPFQVDVPAAPFAEVQQVRLVRAGDVNRDGLDDLALAVNRGAINEELMIVGWRSDAIVSLVQPGERVEMGEIATWPVQEADFTVSHYRVEAPRWNCLSTRPVTWRWSGNFYRPVRDITTAYRPLPTVGCALAEAEPLFAQPPEQTIQTISAILANQSLDRQGAERGSMALTMLYYLTGQTTVAEAQIEGLMLLRENNPWLGQQIDVFVEATADEIAFPIMVCAALDGPQSDGACNVDQVLAYILEENTIRRDADVGQQLRELGLPVQRVLTVSQVGRADRQLVQFALPGASWWSFAPTAPEVYVPAMAETPVAFVITPPPPDAIVLSPLTYDALLVGRSPIEALNLIDNARRSNPALPLPAEARYIRALSYDLLGNRENARQAYYDLWIDFPQTTWGSLAGAHLEKR